MIKKYFILLLLNFSFSYEVGDYINLIDQNKKTLAYCRTGTRCINLWACANAIDNNIDETIELATDAGYDLDHLNPLLDVLNSNSS